MSLAQRISDGWYSKSPWLWLLLPLSLIYWLISIIRRAAFQTGLFSSWQAPVPVVVVGNITVGGTGKTPLVIALIAELKRAGFKPGIISRGYGSAAPFYPFAVDQTTPATHSGDEPLLLAQKTQVPVVIDADRCAAARYLLAHYDCDIIVSDDGLQHYRLARSFEIVVVHAERGFGNGFCLPAGPLREPLGRLRSVDCVVVNGKINGWQFPVRHFGMTLTGAHLVNLKSGDSMALADWHSQPALAIAGIGDPQRFFRQLQRAGVQCECRAFNDHHAYTPEDFDRAAGHAVIMTEKDAVKVKPFARDNWWYLPVTAELDPAFSEFLLSRIKH